MQREHIIKQGLTNFVIILYNGNENRSMLIRNATLAQVQLFLDSGGNQDYSDFCFDNADTDVHLVTLGSPEDWDSQQYNLIMVNGMPSYAYELPQWVVDYEDYPEGKIIPDPTANDNHPSEGE